MMIVLPGCIPVTVFLLVIAYIGCNRAVTVFLLCLSIVTSGAIFVGHLCNQNDLAPNYAGILMGITNTPGTISAFVLPALVGTLVEHGVSEIIIISISDIVIDIVYIIKKKTCFRMFSIHSKHGVTYSGSTSSRRYWLSPCFRYSARPKFKTGTIRMASLLRWQRSKVHSTDSFQPLFFF